MEQLEELFLRTHELYQAFNQLTGSKELHDLRIPVRTIASEVTKIQAQLEKVIREKRGTDEVTRLIKLVYPQQEFQVREGVSPTLV